MNEVVSFLNGIIWSNALIYLCLGAGIFFSIKTRFLQIRHFKDMVRQMFQGKESKRGVSSFQALAVSVSGRVGTGNIAGVATAIAYGGPGAVFWMWVIAFLGSGSAFVESTLAQIYKVEKDGEFRGGPAYYIEKGIKLKWYAIIFAISTIFSVGLFLPGVQSNSIALSLKEAFGLDPSFTGIMLIAALGLIIFGGVKRISHVAQVVVPLMAISYIIVAFVVIGFNIEKLPAVISLIFKSAFNLEPAFGGIIGFAIAWGVKRGIYSNEAGQGTGPQAAAAAEVSHPVKQGLVQAFSVYIDTLFVCSATAFMILISGTYNVKKFGGGFFVNNIGSVEPGPIYTQMAVESVFTGYGSIFVAISLLFFAFTTIMAYYYIAETNIAYLDKGDKRSTAGRWMVVGLRLMLLLSVYYGAVKTASLAWGLGDLGVGIMAWLNIIAILYLHKPAIKALKDYEKQKAMGLDPSFNPEICGIKDADLWQEKSSKPAFSDNSLESQTPLKDPVT